MLCFILQWKRLETFVIVYRILILSLLICLTGLYFEINLDYEPAGIAVDGLSNTVYWSDNERVLLRSAFLNNGTYKDIFNKSDNRPASMSKLGGTDAVFFYYWEFLMMRL